MPPSAPVRQPEIRTQGPQKWLHGPTAPVVGHSNLFHVPSDCPACQMQHLEQIPPAPCNRFRLRTLLPSAQEYPIDRRLAHQPKVLELGRAHRLIPFLDKKLCTPVSMNVLR